MACYLSCGRNTLINKKFIAEMKNLVKSYPTLAQEFTDRLDQSNFSDEEKAKYLERINSLNQPKTQPKLPTHENRRGEEG